MTISNYLRRGFNFLPCGLDIFTPCITVMRYEAKGLTHVPQLKGAVWYPYNGSDVWVEQLFDQLRRCVTLGSHALLTALC